MKFELVTGARKRTNEGWVRVDQVFINNRPIKGQIIVHGRRKHAEDTITQFGSEQRAGSQPYWLACKNGLVVEELA